MKLYLDDVRPAPEGWRLARTTAEAILHLGGGTVEELSLDHDLDVCALCEEELGCGGIVVPCTAHDRGNGLDVVEWMIRTGAWPRMKPLVHSANVERAAIMRDRIDAYWRPRADLEAAPRWTCWAPWESAGDGAEVMGWHTPQEAVAAFARGRWRLVGCPPAMVLAAMDERGKERRFTVVCDAGAFIPTEVEA